MSEFTLPNLGDGVAQGDVLRVLVKPGDTVGNDQPVLELETDKATVEVPINVGGTIKEVRSSPATRSSRAGRPDDRGRRTAARRQRRTPKEERGRRPKKAGSQARRLPTQDAAAGSRAERNPEDSERGEARAAKKTKRAPVVDIRERQVAAPPVSAATTPAVPSTASAPAVAVGSPCRARDRRRHQSGDGHRSGRADYRRRRQGIRPADPEQHGRWRDCARHRRGPVRRHRRCRTSRSGARSSASR